MIIRKNLSKNSLYVIISNPNLYLKELLKGTTIIGFITLILCLFLKIMKLEVYTIPTSMHSLIGIVIGLLLVFRTNTAYDRWWDGRKIIANISHQIGLIYSRIGAINKYNNLESYQQRNNDIIVNSINLNLIEFLENLKTYLIIEDKTNDSIYFHVLQNMKIEECMVLLDKITANEINVKGLYDSLDKLLEYSNHLERIKNTPIPLSYVLHIKTSIFIYLITLPFGMFHDLGIFAVPLVMLVYYIISGVEIISNEIENPFAGDPNDLPTEKMFNNMVNKLNGVVIL